MDNKIKNIVQLVQQITITKNDAELRKLCNVLETEFASSRKFASSIILHLMDNGFDFNKEGYMKKMVDELASINHSDIIKLRNINMKLF